MAMHNKGVSKDARQRVREMSHHVESTSGAYLSISDCQRAHSGCILVGIPGMSIILQRRRRLDGKGHVQSTAIQSNEIIPAIKLSTNPKKYR